MRLRRMPAACVLVVPLGLLTAMPGMKGPARSASSNAEQHSPTDAPAGLHQSATRMSVPEGFQVTLFAGEPDVRQPIAFSIDDRGRLWVIECYSYPNWMPGAQRGRDRILIFEDADGDGRFDSRKTFWDRGDNLFGIELGFGGVWLCATPNLIFIPDRDRNDVPDQEPQIVLDGWDPNSQHNGFNGLKWGPDGWLYGCNGILSNSRVGRPGTPDAERVAINCGVWRFHPTQHRFEVVAHGTTNPWGLDFDDHGEMFITNCVIPHLFHVTPGAHFQRMYGQDINPHAYDLMKSCADHLHWGGGDWTSSRGGKGIHSEAGGGHAHAGAMIYLADNWPDRYRNSIFMCNIHGNRINQDRLHRSGSGYVATHEKDFLLANDQWFRGLELRYGPDGGVFLTDWSDTGECHDYDSQHGAHRDSGRIYKITYGTPRPARVDLGKLTSDELVALLTAKNEWYVRHARRLLQERARAGQDMSTVHRVLVERLTVPGAAPQTLRSLWALHVTGGLTHQRLFDLLSHENEHVRAWAVRLLADDQRLVNPAGLGVWDKLMDKLGAMAAGDPSPLVRRYLASALQRIAHEQRWPIAERLVEHSDDASDQNLPNMIWYGIEPIVASDHAMAATFAGRCKIPTVRRFVARRIVLESDRRPTTAASSSGLVALVDTLWHVAEPDVQMDLLRGMHDALQGRKRMKMPNGWSDLADKLATEPQVRDLATELSLIFGDDRAVATLRGTMMDPSAPAGARHRAIEALVQAGVPDLVPELRRLLDDTAMRGPAIRALAAFGDRSTPSLLLARYGTLTESERADAVGTLASRPAFAQSLLSAIEAGQIPRGDLSPFVARQLQAFGDAEINNRLAHVWGTVRPASKEKTQLMAKYKTLLAQEELKKADMSHGRAIFQRTCAACHKLFGSGGDVGPDLTGSNRDNLDFILENVLDPNAIVGRDYKLTIVATHDGRLISGIVRERFDKALVLATENEQLTLSVDDIEEVKESPVSMMPEGLFEKLSQEEVRDLVAYLADKAR